MASTHGAVHFCFAAARTCSCIQVEVFSGSKRDNYPKLFFFYSFTGFCFEHFFPSKHGMSAKFARPHNLRSSSRRENLQLPRRGWSHAPPYDTHTHQKHTERRKLLCHQKTLSSLAFGSALECLRQDSRSPTNKPGFYTLPRPVNRSCRDRFIFFVRVTNGLD